MFGEKQHRLTGVHFSKFDQKGYDRYQEMKTQTSHELLLLSFGKRKNMNGMDAQFRKIEHGNLSASTFVQETR
jgi:hypothetical protein